MKRRRQGFQLIWSFRSSSSLVAKFKLFCVVAHCSGTRSRVISSSASRQAATDSSSRSVPLSRSPKLDRAIAGLC